MKFSINNTPEVITNICKDDGIFPNNTLPVVIYKSALLLPEEHSAKIFEDIFEKNDWRNSWRNGIYNYHHYHSTTHEVLGIYEGSTTVQLGGEKGFTIWVKKGDVIIIPAGVAHKNVTPDCNFKCVGAYPRGSDYDIKKGDPKERLEADENIKKVELPANDPVYSNKFLPTLWE